MYKKATPLDWDIIGAIHTDCPKTVKNFKGMRADQWLEKDMNMDIACTFFPLLHSFYFSLRLSITTMRSKKQHNDYNQGA